MIGLGMDLFFAGIVWLIIKRKLFRKNSIGVYRLSLVVGAVAGFYRLSGGGAYPYHMPQTPLVTQTDGYSQWYCRFVNLNNLFFEFAIYFIAAWLLIQVIAWVVEGFKQK